MIRNCKNFQNLNFGIASVLSISQCEFQFHLRKTIPIMKLSTVIKKNLRCVLITINNSKNLPKM